MRSRESSYFRPKGPLGRLANEQWTPFNCGLEGWGKCDVTQRTSSLSHCCTAHKPLTHLTQSVTNTIHA